MSTLRETTANWESNDTDGKISSTLVTIVYRSPTVAQLKRQRAAARERYEADPTDIVWVTDELFEVLHSITGIDPPAPSPVTMEWLDDQDVRNLSAVRDAITEDISLGKSRLAKQAAG